MMIVNTRNFATRMHDAVLYTTRKPNSEKYKKNVLYKGALSWNGLSVAIRRSQKYTTLKEILNENLVLGLIPRRDT